ncbi:MAG TPA: beta-ketoacyl synthase N-terminal-like domain-containing protein [Rugosimonospora sp.]|nr:beta-ketoacyl synthase N-terminal-like domain-containing protein [Rugosimonospora sp.]
MAVLLAASAVRTCLGDLDATFAALLAGKDGLVPLRYADSRRLNVAFGYHVDDGPTERPRRASRWLTACVRSAVAGAGLRPERERIVAVVGTGLRELRAVERWAVDGQDVATEQLHFADAVRAALPAVAEVYTVSNACSAGGHALALGQDLIEAGAATAVVVGAADTMTESMLSMIGRVSESPTERLAPFDRHRTGVLLGEGAAALVLVAENRCAAPQARILATGLSCDAYHETAPDPAGIRRAMTGALERAGRLPEDVDLVLAHGTGTALNDPVEATALRTILGTPVVAAIKGAIGHTSGASALHSLAVAIRCLRDGVAPPVVGLREPIPEADGLRLVVGQPVRAAARLAQVDAFGFGGVNAVTLLEGVA